LRLQATIEEFEQRAVRDDDDIKFVNEVDQEVFASEDLQRGHPLPQVAIGEAAPEKFLNDLSPK
jgi:hypothetical protein